MLLQRLKELTERPEFDLPPALYSEGPVRYLIELDADGRLLNPKPIDLADPSSPATRRGQRHLVPQIQRSSGVQPLLLADKADYALGYAGPNAKPERVAACHDAFLALLDRCAAETEEPSVAAIQRFLHGAPLDQLLLDEGFDPSGVITFRVDGVFPISLTPVREFWAAEHDPSRKGGEVGQCLVCGQDRPVLERLQLKIKGVPGGRTSGTSIISANANAFESYGLKASLIAPTCAGCGERFTKAANELLVGKLRESSRMDLGGAAFVFWTREEVQFDLVGYFREPNPEQVQALREYLLWGRGAHTATAVDETQFYATALSGSGGRTVVRDWIDTTVGEVKQNLARWFEAQGIVERDGNEPRPLGLYALAAATVRDAGNDLAPPTPRALLRAALTGGPAPTALLEQAVRRNRAEQAVTRPRASLIKLVLRTNGEIGEGEMTGLNQQHPSPAYHCGRLLAVLEDVQRLAIPGIKATIVDRFFGTASSAPASVFSRLVRGAQPHLGKLERDRPAAHRALQTRLQDVLANLDDFPRILRLQEQGLFALGYYHQHAFDRAAAREAAERRRAGLASSADQGLIDTLEADQDIKEEN